jgi:hypothetical protein
MLGVRHRMASQMTSVAATPFADADSRPRPRVILLAGFPNSGTTIINYMLGQHPQIFAPGELYGFPGRQLKPAKVCACGLPAVVCPFWAEVVSRLGPLATAPAAARMPALYRVLTQLTGRPCIVDVAHDLHAVDAACSLTGIDLTLVHLSRRRMAVLRSRLALNHRQGDIRPYTLRYVHKALGHTRRLLMYQHALAARVRAAGNNAVGVCYEELCEQPRRPLALIGACAGLDFGDVIGKLEAGAPLIPPEHLIRGNARLRGETIIRVARR